MTPPANASPARSASLTERVYARVKDEIFAFRLLPGERFTEGAVAARTGASRTPVREALQRLQREGFVHVHFRSGWQVAPLDFTVFDQLYDLRIVLERAAVETLCARPAPLEGTDLAGPWLVAPSARLDDGPAVCALDEAFHGQIVAAAGNAEMARVHAGLTERLRIVRRLDFTQPARLASTYDEHGRIVRHLLARDAPETSRLLTAHIESSKSAVRAITLAMLEDARRRAAD